MGCTFRTRQPRTRSNRPNARWSITTNVEDDMSQPFTLIKETDSYYNKAAAHDRQKELEKQKAEYFANGGKITVIGEIKS